MLHLVTLVNRASVTSMPINEFVLYRYKHNEYFHIKQSVIICDISSEGKVFFPDDIKVYYTGYSFFNIKKCVKEIGLDAELNDDTLLFHAHHDKVSLLFLASCTKYLGCSVYTVHSSVQDRRFIDKIECIINSLFFRKVTVVSQAAYDKYPRCLKLIKGENVECITNGIDMERIQNSLEHNVNVKNRRILVCVARMIPLKNHSFIIDILRYLPDYKLILIGKEDKKGHIRSLVKKYNLSDRVFFKGEVSREDVYKELSQCGIYVSASKSEGLPISVLEAMGCGLLPILSDIAPHKEIADKCDGVVSIPLNRDIWIRKIKEISELSDDEYIRLANKMKESMKINFSLDTMHDKYLRIYKKLM